MTSGSPRLQAPSGTTDTHIHVYDRRYPMASTAKMYPPDASVADYLAMAKRLGIARTVVVQATTYGTDNRCLLESMAAIGADKARGVAVVDAGVSDAELDRLTRAGVRGVRFFMLPGGALPWRALDAIAARVQPFGWHAQLQFDGREFLEHEAAVRRLPGTLVIDHVGKFLEPVPVDHPAFRALLRLVEEGRTYVKLAAPYETSKEGPPHFDDVGALAKELVRAAPERMLWASNWPHPSAPADRKPDDAVLLDMLLDWAPDEATRQKILVDNPARLYGF
ncbi:MAG: amidohydrolase family protein [Pseudorhodoplanes sp.]|nr:amidohydrolase family protein [Pseudorhodoplanes sp.]